MKYKLYAAFIASVSVVLVLASNETFGQSRAAHGGRSASMHSTAHPSVARSRHHHRGRNAWGLWPATGSFFYGPANGEPDINVTEPIQNNTRYTCTLDIPWDFVHRCPTPAKPPSKRVVIVPYEPGCSAQHVTVPMGDGKEQTISMVRC
jgi:hypothetical protein